jgi:hypothetical protein
MESMKIFVCSLVALSLSCGAAALTLVVHEGGSAMHLDESSARKEGASVSVTTVTDFDKPSDRKAGGMYFTKLSLRSHLLLDCAGKRFQVVDSVWHDGRGATGAGHRFGHNNPQWFGPEWKHYSKSQNVKLFPLVCR